VTHLSLAETARGVELSGGALFKGEDGVVGLLIGAGADLDAGTHSARDTPAMFDRLELLG